MCCNNESKNAEVPFVFGLALGVIVGTAAALLLAPKSGEETRDDLKNVTADLKEKADSFVNVVSEKSKEIIDCAREKINKVTEKKETCKEDTDEDSEEE